MTTSFAPRRWASRTIRNEVNARGVRIHAPEHDQPRVRIVLVGDRRHLAVEPQVRRASRRRAHRARKPRCAEPPPQRRVEIVLRQQTVRAAVGVGQDRLRAPRLPDFAHLLDNPCPSAVSQVTCSNRPSPLRPFRIPGLRMRSGPYTRSSNLRTFAQMKPSVTGLRWEPSIVRTLPFCTETERLQESGQSSGQAVSTTDTGPLS